MRRDDALTKLRSLESFLKARGLAHVYLFGSVARDEAGPGSDVDVAFDIVPGADFDAFDMGGVYLDLVDALGVQVDFVERRSLQSGRDTGVERDSILVFLTLAATLPINAGDPIDLFGDFRKSVIAEAQQVQARTFGGNL